MGGPGRAKALFTCLSLWPRWSRLLPGGAFLCRPTACDAHGAVLRARPCKMAGAAGCCPVLRRPAVETAASGSLLRSRLARAAPHGSPGAQEGPCVGQEARHQERHRRAAPAGLFSFSMPYANLATAGEEAHNANAVRTAKKNESCGRRPLGDGSTRLP